MNSYRLNSFIVLPLLLSLILLLSCQKESAKKVVCWGDSLTQPHIGNGIRGSIQKLFVDDECYPSVLSGMLGEEYNIINCGVGGESTLTIMARQGAFPMKLAHEITLSEMDQVVGTNEDRLFVSSYNEGVVAPLMQNGWGSNTEAHVNPCEIDGREIDIMSEVSSDNNGSCICTYKISSKEKITDSYVLKSGSIVKTEAMKNLRGAYANVFFMGQNGGFRNAAELISQYNAMIKYSLCDKYIIISFHKPNSSVQTIKRMIEMEDSLSNEFGDHFINLRSYMVGRGLEDADLVPTSEDLDSISHGQVPPQLMLDGTHFTNVGCKLIANLVFQKFQELGY